jgi:hypothetical protein
MYDEMMIQIAHTLAQLDRRLARLEVAEFGSGGGGTVSGDYIASVGGTASALRVFGTALIDNVYAAAKVIAGTIAHPNFGGRINISSTSGAVDIQSASMGTINIGHAAGTAAVNGNVGFPGTAAFAYIPTAAGSAVSLVGHVHDQYGGTAGVILADGTRQLTGDWNAGAFNVTIGSALIVAGTASVSGTAVSLSGHTHPEYAGTAHTHDEYAGTASLADYVKTDGSTPLTGDWNAGGVNVTVGGTATFTGGAALGAAIDTSGTATMLEYRQGGTSIFRTGRSDADSYMRLGLGRQADGDSYFELIGDTTYEAFGLRFIRNAGANGASQLAHRGTGVLQFSAQDAADIEFRTNNIERLRLLSTGAATFSEAPQAPSYIGTTITLADSATSTDPLSIGAKAAILVISLGTDGDVALISARGGAILACTIIHAQRSGSFSVTKDNAGDLNMYYESGAFTIQNKRGASRTITVTRIG